MPLIIGVELRETVQRFDFVWMPFALRNFAKGAPVQAKNRRNAQQRRFIEIAFAQFPNCLRTDTSFFGQFRIGNAEAALCFSDDIGGVVFQWNHIGLSVDQLRFVDATRKLYDIESQRQFLNSCSQHRQLETISSVSFSIDVIATLLIPHGTI